MTIKERLKEYRSLEKEIRDLEEEVEVLYTKATAPGKYRLSHEPHGSNKDPDKMADMVADMTDKALCLRDCIRRAKEERKAIEKMIEKLSPTERQIIRLRYAKGHRWEFICVNLGYSWRQTHRIHVRALEKMTHYGT